MELFVTISILAIFALLYSTSRPTKFRLRRDPGSDKWWIETRRGIIYSCEKHYIGGGEMGYPYFSKTYFDTRQLAEDRMHELAEQDRNFHTDGGDKGAWI